jgi:hypothetical protein
MSAATFLMLIMTVANFFVTPKYESEEIKEKPQGFLEVFSSFFKKPGIGMALGMMLPGMASGYIQQWLGYDGFFVWVVIAALPALFLLKFISYPADFGKKTTVPDE